METKTGTIISLNVGEVKNISDHNKKEITSAIFKNSVADQVLFLSKNGLEGDEQADLINHGGIDKAVCVYPNEHYAFWEKKLGRKLVSGSFGENITLADMTEADTYIGDVWSWGEAIVQVSQPRRPCYKVAKRHDTPKLPLYIQDTGYSGYYVRVLREGFVSANDPCKLIERMTDVSVTFVNEITYHDNNNTKAKEQLLNLFPLSSAWKQSIR
jgi:MOSC domain-containing protein YiiM